MAAGIQPLYKLIIKINTPKNGLNMTFHLNGDDEAAVRVKANDVCARLLWTMPGDSEIFYATMNRDNTKRDSRFLKEALGFGKWPPDAPATDTFYDMPTTSLLVRFENADGGSVSRKLGPIPDEVVSSGEVTVAPAAVTAPVVGPVAASLITDAWDVLMNKLIQTIMLQTVHVVAGHAPGGDYVQFGWTSAYALRTAKKKGGRVFSG